MLKRLICLMLALVFVLGLLAGCSTPPDSAGIDGSTSDEVLVNDLAQSVVHALIRYNLGQLAQHGILSAADYEGVFSYALNYTENGKIDWDGYVCDTFADFVSTYDSFMDIKCVTLDTHVTDMQFYDPKEASQLITDAIQRERANHPKQGASYFENKASQIVFDKVAVVQVSVKYRFADEEGVNGETVTYPEQSGTVCVYLVRVDGQWKSISPTLSGVLRPIGFLDRYLTPDETE